LNKANPTISGLEGEFNTGVKGWCKYDVNKDVPENSKKFFFHK
jgi:hypothetical protein